jgi:predicted class III extradiol MEMO1 family dioxygenase
VPKAIIVPHAGYIYSGPIAASAYARLQPARGTITRVVLLGPAHRVGFEGLALSSADYFVTPLGKIPVDRAALDRVSALPQVHRLDAAHAQEHSLEVHLPFLQEVLGDFTLVPLVVGDAGPEEVGAVIELLWGGPESATATSLSRGPRLGNRSRRCSTSCIHAVVDPIGESAIGTSLSRGPRLGNRSRRCSTSCIHAVVDPIGESAIGTSLSRGPRLDPIGETLIVISSDLSHYHDYATAQRLDRATSAAIEALRPQDIGYDQACGRNPVNGLLHVARARGLHARTIDLRNSGDTAGTRDQVVGYGAYVFE